MIFSLILLIVFKSLYSTNLFSLVLKKTEQNNVSNLFTSFVLLSSFNIEITSSKSFLLNLKINDDLKLLLDVISFDNLTNFSFAVFVNDVE